MAPSRRLLACLAVCASLFGDVLPDEPTTIRIVANVDGVDEVRIEHREAHWTHHAWQWPTEVRINEVEWRPDRDAALLAPEERPFLEEGIPLAGATLTQLRGRGTTELGWSAEGLTVRFDDGAHNGADEYEVLLTFADAVAAQSQRYFEAGKAVRAVEVDVEAEIDGADAIFLSSQGASWEHYDAQGPKGVRLNGRDWEVAEHPTLPVEELLALPGFADLSGASLVEQAGRGIIQLDASPPRVVLRFDDRAPWGAASFHARVRLPIEPLALVTVDCDETAEGGRLIVLRYPRDGGSPGPVPGRRVVGSGGQARVALPPGDYGFEVRHRIQSGARTTLVALRSPRLGVDGPRTVELDGLRVTTPALEIAGQGTFAIEDLGVRSLLPVGDVSWRRASPRDDLELVVSRDETYRIRVLAGRGALRAAVWLELPAEELARPEIDADRLISCAFDWFPGTVASADGVVSLQFPDASLDVPLRPEARFLTNRRFLELGYRTRFEDGRPLVFHPRGHVAPPPPAEETILLGGPLQVRAAAAILTNEQLGSSDARQVWYSVALHDASGRVMDASASDVDWQVTAHTRDGAPVPAPPLSPADVAELGDLRDTVRFAVSYRLQEVVTAEVAPEAFVERHSKRVSTTMPAGMPWRSAAYLAKVERSLRSIGAVRGEPVDPDYRVTLKWWLNAGAVGGHGGFTMPLHHMVADFDWYTHPWAISHELLHGLGYGHGADMDRTDHLVQERFDRYRWFVADHPDLVPEALRE